MPSPQCHRWTRELLLWRVRGLPLLVLVVRLVLGGAEVVEMRLLLLLLVLVLLVPVLVVLLLLLWLLVLSLLLMLLLLLLLMLVLLLLLVLSLRLLLVLRLLLMLLLLLRALPLLGPLMVGLPWLVAQLAPNARDLSSSICADAAAAKVFATAPRPAKLATGRPTKPCAFLPQVPLPPRPTSKRKNGDCLAASTTS